MRVVFLAHLRSPPVRPSPARCLGCVSKPPSGTTRSVASCLACRCRRKALCCPRRTCCWLSCTPMRRWGRTIRAPERRLIISTEIQWCVLCFRSWLRFAPGISLLSLSATRRPVTAWQWVSSARKYTQTPSLAFWQPLLEHATSLCPCRGEQARRPAVRGAGWELLRVGVRPQLGPLVPQAAPARLKTSVQRHRAAYFRQPPSR